MLIQLHGGISVPVITHNLRPFVDLSPRWVTEIAQIVDPSGLTGVNACSFIPLNKSPGVQRIGVLEVCHRIISKAIMRIVKCDILEAMASFVLLW